MHGFSGCFDDFLDGPVESLNLRDTLCYNPSLRLDLADDVFVEYTINTCFTPHLCDKTILPIRISPSNINLAHLDINWVGFDSAYLNL